MRVVCFDIGGVLVRICRNWKQATDAARLPLREPEKVLSDAWRSRRAELVGRVQRGQIEMAPYYEAMSEAVEGLYDAHEVERIHHIWMLGEYVGVGLLIDELNRTDGVVTACLSNTNHDHWLRLLGEGPQPEFPSVTRLTHQLASHEMGLAKPDPEIFKSAQAAFQASAEQVLFFDDLAENVEAARAHGWAAEQIDHMGDTTAQIRNHLRRHQVLVSA